MPKSSSSSSSSSSSHLTVVGSAALDTIETPHGRADDALGGSALFMGAAGSLFAPVHIVAIVGDDFPRLEIEFLRARGVDLTGLESVPGKTFRWHGRYYENMNRRDTLSVELGVFEGFNPRLPAAAAQAEILMLANIDPALQTNVLKQTVKPLLVVFDTMNHWITGSRPAIVRLLKNVDMALLNDEELHLLVGGKSTVDNAAKLLEMGPRYAVIKKGEHGAILFTRDQPPFLCPAFPINDPKDPTGAGDSFAGGMLGYLAATNDIGSYNLRRAVVYGTVVASFTVEAFGMKRLETLDADEIEERFRQFRAMVEF
ncbi:MAG: sugar kinase [Calditrichaeota bacterium]|nr:sugar kinase [Calditrichota bacterium]